MSHDNRGPGVRTKSPTLHDLGEKTFLQQLIPKLKQSSGLLTGLGQDAAILQLPPSVDRLAFKIDRSAKPVAVSEGWTDRRAWGRLAVTANCSDILASGADPIAFMVGLTLPGSWLALEAEEIILGCQEECTLRDIVFAGGDTKEGEEPLVTGSAIGVVRLGATSLRRDAAAPGDLLAITGEIGGFLGALLQLLKRDDASEARREQWIRYLANPAAHWDEARFVMNKQLAHAATDTSDGLYDALFELTKTGVGVIVDLNKVVFHEFALECSEVLNIPIEQFLFGGGDWNIVYALKKEAAGRSDHPRIAIVGEFLNKPGRRAVRNGQTFKIFGPRNEHFRHRIEDGRPYAEFVVNGKWLFSEP